MLLAGARTPMLLSGKRTVPHPGSHSWLHTQQVSVSDRASLRSTTTNYRGDNTAFQAPNGREIRTKAIDPEKPNLLSVKKSPCK